MTFLTLVPPIYTNVKQYGALGDGKTVTDGAITTGTPTLTSATAAFVATDAGKQITVNGAGAAAANLNTTISAYVNATTVTLAVNAGTTVSAATVFYATDDTAAIAAARSAINAAGSGVVFYPPGTYISGNQTLYSNVTDIGAGPGATTIKLKNGANTDLFSAQTGSINLSAAAGSGSVGTLSNFGLYGLTLDGNKANQTSGTSYCLRFYGYNFKLRDIEIINGYSNGALIDWNGTLGSGMEATVENVRVHDNNGVGWQMGGPHDSHIVNLFSYRNGSHNIHLAPNAMGTLCVHMHPYWAATGVGAIACLCEAAGCQFVDCMFEGSDSVQFAALASDISILGGHIFGNIGFAGVGLQMGQPAGQTPIPGQIQQSAGVTTAVSVAGLNINTKLTNCTNGAINFWNDGGNNTIIATIYQTSGGVLVSGRLPNANDTILFRTSGLTSDFTLNTESGFQLASSANLAFLFKDRSGNDLFDLDGHAKLFNLANGTGLFMYSDAYTTQKFSITGSTGQVEGVGNWHTSGNMGIGSGTNANINLLINPTNDTHNGIVIYPNSATQSVPLFKVQNSSFADVCTIDKNGNLAATSIAVAQSATAVATATSGTIATANLGVSRVAPTGAVTGVILAAGTVAGQEVCVVNESAFSITFAVVATSNVADGVSAVIAANRKMDFTWDSVTAKWYHS